MEENAAMGVSFLGYRYAGEYTLEGFRTLKYTISRTVLTKKIMLR